MNDSQPYSATTGYLVVQVSTARGAIPLEDASVTVRGTEKENSGVIRSLITGRDGKTETIELPTPPRVLSQSPGTVTPYALYDVDVFKEGYADLFIQKIPVFGSVTAIQPAIMIPLPDNRFPDSYDVSENQSPSDTRRGGDE